MTENINVLIYMNHPEDENNACSVYRNYTPMKYANGLNVRFKHKAEIQWDVNREEQKIEGMDIDTSDVDWADVVVFNRIYENVAIMGAMAGYALNKGKLVVYETDDLYHKINENIGVDELPEFNANAQRFIDWVIENGASVTASTEDLAEEMIEHFDMNEDKVGVLKNYYDPDHWRWLYQYKKARDFFRKKIKRDEKVRIGWFGGNNHFLTNFNYLVPALNKLNKEHGSEFEFVVRAGQHPNVSLYEEAADKKKYLDFDIDYRPPVEVEKFPKALADMDIDIGLAVMEDNDFSNSRSHIKWMEYGLLGIPCIASDVSPYQETNAMLVDNSVGQWCSAMEHLLFNEDVRDTMGTRARELALGYNAKEHAHKWIEFYREQLKKL